MVAIKLINIGYTRIFTEVMMDHNLFYTGENRKHVVEKFFIDDRRYQKVQKNTIVYLIILRVNSQYETLNGDGVNMGKL